MNKYEERLKSIREDREKLLRMVKKSLEENNEQVVCSAKNIERVIEYDENNMKKYENILKVREYIENIASSIINSKSKEEVEALRSELNKSIAKVRREMKKRNIDETKYNQDILNLRKDISKYIRIVKREETLTTIEDLSKRVDTLNEEELLELRKLLRREKSYNTRNLNTDKKEVAVVDNTPEFLRELFKKERENNPVRVDTPLFFEVKEKPKTLPIELDPEYESERDFISEQVKGFKERYHLAKTNVYTRNTASNVVSFLKNIPIYVENKKRIKKMQNEAGVFYRGNDLVGFIEYQREKNSLKSGLRSIFGRSTLYNKDNEYMAEHEKCIRFIQDYCKDNSLSISYKQKTL